MCGIAGMLLGKGKIADRLRVEAMGWTLVHRGPDHFGCYADQNYAVSQTRLSILDLSAAGNQPFVNDRYTLVYNGEIYNYLDLRENILDQNINLEGTSDTEVLFHHLICFGVEATLKKLKGMFAFSFYDSEEEVLFVCRDRLGIKPLVYIRQDDDFFWASEVKALAKVANVEIDPIRLLISADYMFDGRNEQTVFRSVKNVLPGSYLVVKAGQEPVSHSYHDLTEEISEDYYKSLDKLTLPEVVNRFNELLEQSIRSMLISDAPMGVFASGGIDSSLIAAMAFQQKPELSLFTSNVVGKYSEIEDARLLSRAIGTPLHEADYGHDQILSTWARSTWFYEAPIITHVNALPLGEVAELARQEKVKAVLTGEGADELFLGYPIYVARRYKKLTMPVDLLIKLYGVIPSARRFLFPKDTSNIHSFFAQLISNFEEKINEDKFVNAYGFLPESKRQDQIATTTLIRSHLISLLHRNDRMGMMAGIESRFPFLDDEIIRFALNLPVKFKIRRTGKVHNRRHPFLMDKAIVRETCKGNIPDAIANKVKMGFPTHGHQSMVVQSGFFDDGYLEDVFQLSKSGKEQLLSSNWRFFAAKLASLEVFGRLFEYEHSPEEITEHLQKFVTIDQTLSSKAEIM